MLIYDFFILYFVSIHLDETLLITTVADQDPVVLTKSSKLFEASILPGVITEQPAAAGIDHCALTGIDRTITSCHEFRQMSEGLTVA